MRYLLESTFNSSTWPRPCLDDASCQSSDTVQLILVITVSTFLSVATVTGNVLVLLSVKINRRLRSVNNYFLLSLAVADLAVGLISMNLYTMYHLCGRWPLGALLCDLWLVLDYWVGNASVLNLLLISLDRYFCVTRPFTYPSQRSGRTAAVMIAAVWLLALLIWAPAILAWQNGAGRRGVPDGHCYILLLSSPAGTLATTIPSFYLPALVMIGLYGRISYASRGRLGSTIPMVQQRKRSWVSVDPETDTVNQSEFNSSFKDRRNKRPSEQIEGGTTSPPPCQPSDPNHDTNPNLNMNPNPHTIPDANTDGNNLNTDADVITDINSSPDLNTKTYTGPSTNTKLAQTGDGYGSVSSPTLARFHSFGRAGRRRRVLARERRVTKTILSILLAFLVTWTPHNVMAVVAAFCHSCIPGGLWSAGYWLCYVNSTINPCCYALCNVNFRKTFRRILRCRRRNN